MTRAGRYQVVIVGGGPVGAGLAVDLGLRGVSCALVERSDTPQRIPKGQNLTQRTMEHFRVWGIEDEIRAARVMPPGYPIAGVTAYDNLAGPYSYPWYRRRDVGDYYFASNERLPQYATEAVLRARAESLPAVDCFWGWSATAVDQGEASARVGIATATGNALDLEGEYVVGCDGSHSIVREIAGISEERSDHDRLMVLMVFRSRQLHEALDRFGDVSFFKVLHPDLDGYWQFLGRVDVGEEWFFHAPIELGTVKEDLDPASVLLRATGTEVEVELDYIGLWDLRIAIASIYQRGRILIAGDAAHSHPPYGGYGVNTGLEDARNLGWKLAATFDGWGGDRLVASYTQERRPVFVSTARDFIEFFVQQDRDLLARYDPSRDRAAFERAWDDHRKAGAAGVHGFEPHYEGSPLVLGPVGGRPGATGTHEFTARAGHHLAPRPLSVGSDLFDRLGAGFTLLALDADDSAIAAFGEAAASMDLPFEIVIDSFAEGREAYGSHMVLVRPDHFVAWVGDGAPVDPAEVLRVVVGGRPAIG